MGKKWDINLRK